MITYVPEITQMSHIRQSLKRSLRYTALTFVVLGAFSLSYVTLLRVSGNFHVVADGSLYRSAQPSERDIQRYVKDFGIRSVINLRANANVADGEAKTAEELGLTYIHYPLPAVRLLKANEVMGIIKVLADAPKPILVHSYFGSDRAGLVSALYLYAVEGRPAKEAASQLSPAYGHLPYLGNPTGAMDKTLVAVVSIESGR